jgi:hypothetical protein
MALRQIRRHANSNTIWLCDGTTRTEIPANGRGGFSQNNLINALLQDPETQDMRTVGPPGSDYFILALHNLDA